MSEGLGIIAKFLYIIAVIVIAHGGWQVRTGNADQGKLSIVGGLLLGLAVVIADALFRLWASRPPGTVCYFDLPLHHEAMIRVCLRVGYGVCGRSNLQEFFETRIGFTSIR